MAGDVPLMKINLASTTINVVASTTFNVDGYWLTLRELQLRDTIKSIVAVLGTGQCRINTCESCAYEHGEAVRLAQQALADLSKVYIKGVSDEL